MNMAHLLFWSAALLLVLGSFGYPLLLWAWATLKTRPVRKLAGRTPKVSVVLPCFNEEAYIGAKITNLLSLEYPPEQLELVFVSDGSTDGTLAIIDSFMPHPQIKLFALQERQGKPHALNTGVSAATGELILFSDSRQLFNSGALLALVENFSDPAVGGASGTLLDFTVNPSAALTHGKRSLLTAWFRKLENRLKIWESRIHSVVGVYGALYAIRRELYRPLPLNIILDDMFVPFSIIEQGYRVVFDPAATAAELTKPSPAVEVGRRRRIFTGNFQFLWADKNLYRFRANPVLVQWVLHKVLRLIFPVLLLQLFVSNLALPGVASRLFLFAQSSVYGLCMVGMIFKRPAVFYLFSEFIIAVLLGFHAAVTKSYSVKWQKQT